MVGHVSGEGVASRGSDGEFWGLARRYSRGGRVGFKGGRFSEWDGGGVGRV